MGITYIIDQKTGRAFFYVSPSSASASTFQNDHIKVDAKAAVAEANFIVRSATFPSTLLPKKVDDVDDEEQEWDALFAMPHVQAGLSRLAEEAKRQFAAGETEEGGFAVE